MRNRPHIRALLVLACAALFSLACNLSRTPPTPTQSPVLPTVPGNNTISPTLFPSITPLPGTGPIATQLPGSTTCSIPVGWIEYVVETGDSLGALAEATQTTVTDLVNGNCLPNADTLYVGQTIYLPRSPISG
jgi:hypothetical protein